MKLQKYIDEIQKSSTPEPQGQKSTKLGTKLPLVKEIQVSSNEEPINSHEVNNVFLFS